MSRTRNEDISAAGTCKGPTLFSSCWPQFGLYLRLTKNSRKTSMTVSTHALLEINGQKSSHRASESVVGDVQFCQSYQSCQHAELPCKMIR